MESGGNRTIKQLGLAFAVVALLFTLHPAAAQETPLKIFISVGMVQGLDPSFDAVIFLGYHACAGTENAFLAHTGLGAVKGLWLNGIEVGEGGLNAAYAGELGVPVILAAGDSTFARQIHERIGTLAVATKEAIGNEVCRLYHPQVVRERLNLA